MNKLFLCLMIVLLVLGCNLQTEFDAPLSSYALEKIISYSKDQDVAELVKTSLCDLNARRILDSRIIEILGECKDNPQILKEICYGIMQTLEESEWHETPDMLFLNRVYWFCVIRIANLGSGEAHDAYVDLWRKFGGDAGESLLFEECYKKCFTRKPIMTGE